jgi:hypothetical protein
MFILSEWARDPAKRLRLHLVTFVAYVPIITCFAFLSQSILLAALAFRWLAVLRGRSVASTQRTWVDCRRVIAHLLVLLASTLALVRLSVRK